MLTFHFLFVLEVATATKICCASDCLSLRLVIMDIISVQVIWFNFENISEWWTAVNVQAISRDSF
jgi:hypothetical protein